MAVDLDYIMPTSDRIASAATLQQLYEISAEVHQALEDCVAVKGWDQAPFCEAMAKTLNTQIAAQKQALAMVAGAELEGAEIVITSGPGPGAPPAQKPVPIQVQAPKIATAGLGGGLGGGAGLMGVALLGVGAWFLWRYTQR